MLLWFTYEVGRYTRAIPGITVDFLKNADVKHPRPLQVLIWWAHMLPWTFPVFSNGNGILTSPCPPIGANVCHVTTDRGSINTSDAVVFAAESADLADLPPYRRQSQAWVFFAEGPHQWTPSQDLSQTVPIFNWTMAFREDSDIVVPYKAWKPIFGIPNVSKRVATFRAKARTAVWMISECEKQKLEISGNSSVAGSPWSGTERFINIVLDRIDVDIIFDCGRHLCASRHECLNLLKDEYCFVFVMESSPCFEHPAQFIYDSFYYDIIPVLFGVGDFKHPLPPQTFIDTSKLEDPSDAVDALRKTGFSPRAYVNFMTQRQDSVHMLAVNSMCALCNALYAPPEKPLHKDSLLWWRNRSDCSVHRRTVV
ncbi:hypothetical protein V5799_014118 [Amblyomma americanum]|uniref:Fucosyltransferase n=1 Tax=Amblyomma americanum TaxID=6943 RepID=A0AAQ4E3Z7_AMBAM